MLDWQWLRRRNLSDGLKRIIVICISLLSVYIIYMLLKVRLPLQILGLSIGEGLFDNLVSSLLIVLLIDGLRSISADVEVRKSLILRAASTSNETAKAAIDELRKTGLIDRGVLRGRDLSGANLCGAMLENVDLSGVNLTNANLSNANLSGAKLIDANLNGTKFYRAKMTKAQMGGANVMKTDFYKADLTDVRFKNSLLDEAGSPNINSAIFKETKLIRVDFSHLKTMKGSTFSKCDLQSVLFNDCTLENANFTESKLNKADLSNANLRRCDFSQCDLADAILENADLKNTDITGANLARATLPDGSKWDNAREAEILQKFGIHRTDEGRPSEDEYADDEDEPSNFPEMR